jgi:hypothetical protein
MPATFYVIVQILSESSSENEPPVHPCIVARGPWPVARGSWLEIRSFRICGPTRMATYGDTARSILKYRSTPNWNSNNRQ